MKTPLLLLVFLCTLPRVSSAQISAEPLIAFGFVSPKNQCAERYEYMRADLQSAFESFIRKNDRFFDAQMWRSLESIPSPGTNRPSEADCKAYLRDLPTFDVDQLIERTRKDSECTREATEIYEHLGSRRPRIGIDLDGKSSTSTVQSVEPNSPAFRSGLRKGDIIRAVGNTPVETQCSLVLAIMKLKPGESTVFLVARGDSTFKVKIAPVVAGE